jgi:hypothetical protein
MKKTLFCLAATCMFAMSGLAQSGSSATSSGTQTTTTEKPSTSTKAQSTKAKTLTGCIEAGSEANEYMLKTGSSKKPIELISSEDLKAHVGHTVKVTGNWSSEASEKKEMGGGTEQAQHKEAAGERHFKAEKVDMVSDTCTMGKATKSKAPKS